MSEGTLQQNADAYANLGKAARQAGQKLAGAAGNDLLENATPVGKGVLITWWILLVAVFIYMIVLAVIYYNDYTKWQYNDVKKQWEWNTGKKDEKTGLEIVEVYEGLTEDEIVTWNIHKTVMNGLLAFMNIFGIYIVLFGIGRIEKPAKDVCGSDQLGWLCVLNIIWFIVNMVWDIKNSQFTKAEQTTNSGTEKFCGMMETFCGSVSEGFSNVAKKLRKF